MKWLFIVTLVMSVVGGGYAFRIELDSARTQASLKRHSMALAMEKPSAYAVSRRQMSEYPPEFGEAHEDAIQAGNAMVGFFLKEATVACLLAFLLFVASVVGLCSCRGKKDRVKGFQS